MSQYWYISHVVGKERLRMSQYWYISHVVGKERLRCHSTGTFLMWLERRD